MKKILCVLLLHLTIAISIAQNPYIRHYTTIDGLPSNTVYQIYQDSRKFIWFTTDAGVVKFDGSIFTNYRKKHGLSNNDVIRIKEDSIGRIWFFNYNASVNYYYNGKIYNGKNAPFLNSLMGKGFIVDFFTDSNRNICFYNLQREVYQLDSNNLVTRYQLFNSAVTRPLAWDIRESVRVAFIKKNASNNFLIWTNYGIYCQSNFKGNITTIDSNVNILGVFPSNNNIYYVRTTGKGIIRFTKELKKEYISFPGDSQKIKTILEDSDGYLWIAASDEGVYCIKNNKIIRHFYIKNALGLLQDNEKNIWISSESDGLYLINHDLLTQNHFDKSYFENSGINVLYKGRMEDIWCTNGRTIFLLRDNSIYTLKLKNQNRSFNLIHELMNNELLIGTKSYGLNTLEGLELNKVTKEINYQKRTFYPFGLKKIIENYTGSEITMFDQNRITVTSSNKPLPHLNENYLSERINNVFYNTKNEVVINARKNYLYRNNHLEKYPDLTRFNGTIITDHLVLGDSAEIFNIDGDTLYLYKNHRFYNLSLAFNAPIPLQIKKILYDESVLYLATLKDIFKCNNPLNILSQLPIKLEPLNISFNNINDILIVNDSLYIASDEGLTIISEKAISKSIASSPIPYFQSIKINEKNCLLPTQELNLTGNNKINLTFGSISFSSSSVIYSYKLEGAETEWTNGTGNGINVVYQNLHKGRYIFKLRVRKSNSDWSIPLELKITIKPALWQHPIFWAVVLFFTGAFIFLLVYRIKIQKMKRQEIDHQLILMEQKALQSMMNPHFIFNSLGSIQNYLLKNKGKEAVIYLSQFARLVRQNLNAINSAMISLDEEVDRLRNYLDLEKIRLENKFQYFIETDELIKEDDVLIPSMIIQPFAENSIWHGIATIESNAIINIQFQILSQNAMKIVIEDNGVGMIQSREYSSKTGNHLHLGMAMTQKRLYLLGKKYKMETSISYCELSPGELNPGTKVELIVPFVYN